VEGEGSDLTNASGFYSVVVSTTGDYTVFSTLQGDHLAVFDSTGDELMHAGTANTSTYHNWYWNSSGNYDADTDDQVNAWYHATKFYNYLNDLEYDIIDEGYQNPSNPDPEGRMQIFVRKENYYNASYNTDTRDLTFGIGPDPILYNSALYSDIIYHEYGHSVTHHLQGLIWPSTVEHSSIHEGFSDYWAATMTDDPVHAEGFNPNPRTLDNTLRYPDDYIDHIGSQHHNGQIIGGSVWDTRVVLGQEITDNLFLEATKLSAITFSGFLDDILITSDLYYGDGDGNVTTSTPYLDDILYCFADHGIYSNDNSIPPPAPRFLDITSSSNNHPYLTWQDDSNPFIAELHHIYKKTLNGSWFFLASTSADYYEDESELTYSGGVKKKIYYKVKTQEYIYSNYSDSITAIVQGYPFVESIAIDNLDPVIIEYSLGQNYPNPFNPETEIAFTVLDDHHVRLTVYDVQGKQVATLVDGFFQKGKYTAVFKAGELSSGLYFYNIEMGDFTSIKRMLLIK